MHNDLRTYVPVRWRAMTAQLTSGVWADTQNCLPCMTRPFARLFTSNRVRRRLGKTARHDKPEFLPAVRDKLSFWLSRMVGIQTALLTTIIWILELRTLNTYIAWQQLYLTIHSWAIIYIAIRGMCRSEYVHYHKFYCLISSAVLF